MSKTINGRGPNGRAVNKDGTERKARVTLSPFEKAAKARKQRENENRSLGKDILRIVPSLAGFRECIGKVRGYHRTAVEFGTPEKRAAKREWYESQIADIEGKGEVAETYLKQSGDTLASLDGIEARVGSDVMEFMNDNQRAPDETEMSEIVSAHITAEDIAFVESASDPDKDPFADYRRGADSDDSEDTETL